MWPPSTASPPRPRWSKSLRGLRGFVRMQRLSSSLWRRIELTTVFGWPLGGPVGVCAGAYGLVAEI
eukprot:3200220-Pyramimonas_sp.AAC.1